MSIKPLNAKGRVLWALQTADGKRLNAWDLALLLNISPRTAETVLPALAREHPEIQRTVGTHKALSLWWWTALELAAITAVIAAAPEPAAFTPEIATVAQWPFRPDREHRRHVWLTTLDRVPETGAPNDGRIAVCVGGGDCPQTRLMAVGPILRRRDHSGDARRDALAVAGRLGAAEHWGLVGSATP